MTEPRPLATVTFVGNATTVLRLGAFTVLTDPAFSPAGSRAYLGYGAWTRRVKDPAFAVADLPTLDGILLSHLHADHFDRTARAELPRDLPIVTTPQAQRRLTRRRYADVRGLPTWESDEWTRGNQRLRVTSVPGRHGPGVASRLLPNVMGSVVELEVAGSLVVRLYITGDTLARPFLADVVQRCGAIDAMLIHLGGTRLLGMLLTMDDRQGVQVAELIRPRMTVPIHYDDYTVFTSPLQDFLRRSAQRGVTGVRPVARGETAELPVRDPAP